MRQAPDRSVLPAGRTAKRISLESANRSLSRVPWVTTWSNFTMRVLRTSASMATRPYGSHGAAPPLQAQAQRGVCFPSSSCAVSCGFGVDEHAIAVPPTLSVLSGYDGQLRALHGCCTWPRATRCHAVRLDSGKTRLSRARRPLRRSCTTVSLMGAVQDQQDFRCADAESGTDTCGTTQPVNLDIVAIMVFSHPFTT